LPSFGEKVMADPASMRVTSAGPVRGKTDLRHAPGRTESSERSQRAESGRIGLTELSELCGGGHWRSFARARNTGAVQLTHAS
jgi:hypothetical protein